MHGRLDACGRAYLRAAGGPGRLGGELAEVLGAAGCDRRSTGLYAWACHRAYSRRARQAGMSACPRLEKGWKGPFRGCAGHLRQAESRRGSEGICFAGLAALAGCLSVPALAYGLRLPTHSRMRLPAGCRTMPTSEPVHVLQHTVRYVCRST